MVAEIEAIGRVLTLAEWTGARVHIAHHSAADSLFLIREAKRRGVDVTVETCPQYLLLNTDHTDRLGGILRLNPPIREPRHNQPLWDALMDGTIDMIATDHAPHAPEEKTRENIWECDCGFPGITEDECVGARGLADTTGAKHTIGPHVCAPHPRREGPQAHLRGWRSAPVHCLPPLSLAALHLSPK